MPNCCSNAFNFNSNDWLLSIQLIKLFTILLFAEHPTFRLLALHIGLQLRLMGIVLGMQGELIINQSIGKKNFILTLATQDVSC